MDKTHDYRTLEEIRQRKNELRRQIDRDNEHISQLWGSLFVKRKDSTTGQFVTNLLSHGAMMIDAFLLVRKLRRDYGGLMQSLRRKKS
ncbi:MAG: hypothetical protein J6V97_08155 [Prevotella sp.]|nr:hypothetical protein [Prevotella sp.]